MREEGFIATSKQKSGGGVAFEIIEATPETESASSSKFKPKVSDERSDESRFRDRMRRPRWGAGEEGKEWAGRGLKRCGSGYGLRGRGKWREQD